MREFQEQSRQCIRGTDDTMKIESNVSVTHIWNPQIAQKTAHSKFCGL